MTDSTRRFESSTTTPAWPVLAEAELRRIEQALGDLAIRAEHVGSTAVTGLAAKPIVDLQLSVDRIEPRERYVQPLRRIGYLFVPAPESPDRYFFAKPPERPRTHHLHLCAAGSATEFRHIAVRDVLRAHADEATRYAASSASWLRATRRTASPISKARTDTSWRSKSAP